MSDLVENPEDRFSLVAAHFLSQDDLITLPQQMLSFFFPDIVFNIFRTLSDVNAKHNIVSRMRLISIIENVTVTWPCLMLFVKKYFNNVPT